MCGRRLLGPLVQECCTECAHIERPFLRAVAYGSYQGGLRELIHLLKYDRVRPAAAVLGRMLAEVVAPLSSEFGPTPPCVIPIPLHANKQRQRGFNQSELIARAAMRHLPGGLSLSRSALVRRRMTESQTGLTRAQRRLNIRGAFKVVRRSEIAGRDILLVDDVFTTGTTSSECARVLRRAGAGRVWVATVARVLKPEAAGLNPGEEASMAQAAGRA